MKRMSERRPSGTLPDPDRPQPNAVSPTPSASVRSWRAMPASTNSPIGAFQFSRATASGTLSSSVSTSAGLFGSAVCVSGFSSASWSVSALPSGVVYRTIACRLNTVPSSGPTKSVVSGSTARFWKVDHSCPASTLPYSMKPRRKVGT